MSLPVRGRGSKHSQKGIWRLPESRSPCGGVDRNTLRAHDVLAAPRRSPCGGVDRNAGHPANRNPQSRRSPCGGVDRNTHIGRVGDRRPGRSPCGGVDRNLHTDGGMVANLVAPRAGAWIETRGISNVCRNRLSLPVRGRGSKHSQRWCWSLARLSLPVRGRGSKPRSADQRGFRAGSLPVRGRGSKRDGVVGPDDVRCRSPCGGVDRNTKVRTFVMLG